jgi:hypothetical protein
MLPHPDSVIAFGLIRHQELQAENLRVRIARTAVLSRPVQPEGMRRMRSWMGSVLIRVGISLRAETREPGAPPVAFHAGAS